MNAPLLSNLNVSGKRIIVRADLDVSFIGNELKDTTRLTDLFATLNWLYENGAVKILLIGHMGRPNGEANSTYSLLPVVDFLKKNYNPEVAFLPHVPRSEFFETYDLYSQTKERLVVLENLRFYKDEENNDQAFAEELMFFGEAYVNEAFASSHREHASVSALPRLIKAKYPQSVSIGLHFEKEIQNLSKLLSNENHPIVFVISGLKEDKLTFLDAFKKIADQILIAGKLPDLMPDEKGDPKVVVARLNPDKEDITIHSIEQFEQTVLSAKTIFVSGPIGKYEDSGHLLGTQRVFEAIAKSDSLKIAGGGDTTAAIHALKLEKSFDWISTGGGASLEFIAKGGLPGIDALM